MINLISRSNLCIDVYLKNNYIGEMTRSGSRNWSFTQTVMVGLTEDNLLDISKQLSELNKGDK